MVGICWRSLLKEGGGGFIFKEKILEEKKKKKKIEEKGGKERFLISIKVISLCYTTSLFGVVRLSRL